jgi:LytS/YehU family sensor histidine kinase
MLAVAAALAPWYWDQMYVPQLSSGLRLSPFQFLWRYVLSGGFQTQLLIGAWIFVFIGASRSGAAARALLLNERLQVALKEAQLSSLSNQLNPHFLFNALNNIRFMIHEDAGRADRTLVALSELLRYSLEGARSDTLPLCREVEMVERYIAVAASQLEDRLDFTLELADGLRDWPVPPMLLQMLVENAVKHGIEPARHGGRVRVDIAEQDRRLVCSVVNDLDARSDAPQADGMGIGLRNIERRLQLLYGARATLAAGRRDGRFAATITLPREPL